VNGKSHLLFSFLVVAGAYTLLRLSGIPTNLYIAAVAVAFGVVPDLDLKAGIKWHRWGILHSALFPVLGFLYTALWSPGDPTDWYACGYVALAWSTHLWGDCRSGKAITLVPGISKGGKFARLFLVANAATASALGIAGIAMVLG